MRTGRRVRKKKESSAEVIACNDDMLTELLLRLPVKSLLQLKFVRKHWLSLISNPQFTRRKGLEPNALFFFNLQSPSSQKCGLLPLDGSNRRAGLKYLNFEDFPADIHIVQSCNGLFLSWRDTYLVCNPSAKQFKTLPPIGAGKSLLAISLALDPSISQSYKVVCIQCCRYSPNGRPILIYSSETGHWKASGVPFTAATSRARLQTVVAPSMARFRTAVAYWNGAIHWFNRMM